MYLLPFPGLQQQAGSFQIPVPPRVGRAVDFVSLMASKTSPLIAANDVAIEVQPGQILTDEESNALATACNLLSSYFAGKLEPDCFERQALKDDAVLQGGLRNSCPKCCGTPGSMDCVYCKGSGAILILPARR